VFTFLRLKTFTNRLDNGPYMDHVPLRSLKPSTINSFSFGARATGKATLLQEQKFLENALHFDLLDPELEVRFATNPQLLWERSSRLSPRDWVVIDEVQKVPKLFGRSVRKVQKKSPKFYFFDSGVKRAIAVALRSPLNPGTYDFGSEFESWFINECYRDPLARIVDGVEVLHWKDAFQEIFSLQPLT